MQQRAPLVALVQRIDAHGRDVCAAFAEASGCGRERRIKDAHLARSRGQPKAWRAAEDAEVEVEQRWRVGVFQGEDDG